MIYNNFTLSFCYSFNYLQIWKISLWYIIYRIDKIMLLSVMATYQLRCYQKLSQLLKTVKHAIIANTFWVEINA